MKIQYIVHWKHVTVLIHLEIEHRILVLADNQIFLLGQLDCLSVTDQVTLGHTDEQLIPDLQVNMLTSIIQQSEIGEIIL